MNNAKKTCHVGQRPAVHELQGDGDGPVAVESAVERHDVFRGRVVPAPAQAAKSVQRMNACPARTQAQAQAHTHHRDRNHRGEGGDTNDNGLQRRSSSGNGANMHTRSFARSFVA